MYKLTVGLEIHTELNTKTKIFSPSKNEYTLDSNINVSELDIALPGSMPVLNKEVLKKAIKLAKIFNMDIAREIIFDRKHYFYPDLPKGYQITQHTLPIGLSGTYKLLSEKVVRIHDIHIEEDTASLDHYEDYTLIDYNRCGIPLIEIVTEPDFESVEEAINFLEDLRLILRNNNLSEADVTKGHIRCDVNVSVRSEKQKELGTRVEIKNVNSFTNVKKVIESEYKRQVKLLEEKKEVLQETRRYDEESDTTVLMRKKEDAIDYRYFVESNIPIFNLDEEFIENTGNDYTLPNDLLSKYTKEYSISLINAKKIIRSKELIDYFEKCLDLKIDPIKLTNLVTGPILEYLNKKEIDINKYSLTPEELKELIDLNEKEEISSKQVKEIILNINEEQLSLEKYIKKHNIKQISNEKELTKIINEILEKNKEKIEEYKNGNSNIKKYFIGLIMKETKGKCNPIKTNEILEKLLRGE